jgi:hypothetical protein
MVLTMADSFSKRQQKIRDQKVATDEEKKTLATCFE